MGDTIKFRGRYRFLAFVDSRGLSLEKLYENGYISKVTHYAITPAERKTIRVVVAGNPATRARARKLLEQSCLPHTRIEWSDDDWPTYVFTVGGVESRRERRR